MYLQKIIYKTPTLAEMHILAKTKPQTLPLVSDSIGGMRSGVYAAPGSVFTETSTGSRYVLNDDNTWTMLPSDGGTSSSDFILNEVTVPSGKNGAFFLMKNISSQALTVELYSGSTHQGTCTVPYEGQTITAVRDGNTVTVPSYGYKPVFIKGTSGTVCSVRVTSTEFETSGTSFFSKFYIITSAAADTSEIIISAENELILQDNERQCKKRFDGTAYAGIYKTKDNWIHGLVVGNNQDTVRVMASFDGYITRDQDIHTVTVNENTFYYSSYLGAAYNHIEEPPQLYSDEGHKYLGKYYDILEYAFEGAINLAEISAAIIQSP